MANIKPNPRALGCFTSAILAIKTGIDIHVWFGVGVFFGRNQWGFFKLYFQYEK